MNSVSVNLSSVQDPGKIDMYNHYWFVDVLSGTNFTYPNTADGDFFNYTLQPQVTANDGLFFPWGYVFQDTSQIIHLGKYKGYTTLYFVGSSLASNYFPILRINYDFGDGTSYENARNVLIDYSKLSIDSYLNGYSFGDPKMVTVSHVYEPSDTTFSTTYTAHVRALNGNLVTNNFYITIEIVQDSIFDFDEVNLLDTKFISLTGSDKHVINVLELQNPDYVINNLLKYTDVDTTQ